MYLNEIIIVVTTRTNLQSDKLKFKRKYNYEKLNEGKETQFQKKNGFIV